ncbi:MAG: dephospho-CoA kinase [Clostridia bacterium]|nr:dephospho-CoA kinase [Clostridia bacterium]
MLVFGITGGSGTGKSTASECFRRLGIYVIDADLAARHVVEKGEPCLDELIMKFGTEILNFDGTLNRKKLGSIVFADEKKLKSLNTITHKHIKKFIVNKLQSLNVEVAAIDGAVIIGSDIEDLCSFFVSVLADRETRLKRIMKRDSLDYTQAQNRLNSQPDDKFYIENSKYIIYNNSDEHNLSSQIKEVCREIIENEV